MAASSVTSAAVAARNGGGTRGILTAWRYAPATCPLGTRSMDGRRARRRRQRHADTGRGAGLAAASDLADARLTQADGHTV